MEKIIIAVDHNEQTNEVIAMGIMLAKKLNTSIELLTVVDSSLSLTAPTTGILFDNQWEARLHFARAELTKVKHEYPDLQIDITAFIGLPKEDIIKEISEKKPAFVIVGTHGRSAFAQFVIGGTAEHIVRHSIAPVVVVPYNKNEH